MLRKAQYRVVIPISKTFMAPHSSEDQAQTVQLDKEPKNKLSKPYLPSTNQCYSYTKLHTLP